MASFTRGTTSMGSACVHSLDQFQIGEQTMDAGNSDVGNRLNLIPLDLGCDAGFLRHRWSAVPAQIMAIFPLPLILPSLHQRNVRDSG